MNEWKYIIIPIISVVLAQVTKFTIESIKDNKLSWKRLFNGNGGMPSSHSAFTFSLVAAIGLSEGPTSQIFAVAFVLACIVAYDAMGLRMESGRQAQAINLLNNKVFDKPSKKIKKQLKEQLGHKPLEVFMGIIFGTIVAYITLLLIK